MSKGSMEPLRCPDTELQSPFHIHLQCHPAFPIFWDYLNFTYYQPLQLKYFLTEAEEGQFIPSMLCG